MSCCGALGHCLLAGRQVALAHADSALHPVTARVADVYIHIDFEPGAYQRLSNEARDRALAAFCRTFDDNAQLGRTTHENPELFRRWLHDTRRGRSDPLRRLPAGLERGPLSERPDVSVPVRNAHGRERSWMRWRTEAAWELPLPLHQQARSPGVHDLPPALLTAASKLGLPLGGNVLRAPMQSGGTSGRLRLGVGTVLFRRPDVFAQRAARDLAASSVFDRDGQGSAGTLPSPACSDLPQIVRAGSNLFSKLAPLFRVRDVGSKIHTARILARLLLQFNSSARGAAAANALAWLAA